MNLRRLMVDPVRGAWTWCHLWMDVGELVLHAEFDWMREPLFDEGRVPPSDAGCAQELELHPRSPEFVPAWMAVGAARHRSATPVLDVDVLGLLKRLFPDTPDIDGNGLWVWPDSREGVEERVRRVLAEWLPGTGAQRVDIDSYVVDTYEVMETRLRMRDGAAVSVTLTEPDAWFWGERVRRVMVDPVRGAWTHAHLWMDSDDLVLHAEYDWDACPPFVGQVRQEALASWCANELARFPRSPEHTPDWLAERASSTSARS